MVSELVFRRTDIIAQPARDAISECFNIAYHCIILDRRNPKSRVNNSCDIYFFLETHDTTERQYVEIPSRRVHNHSPKINCDQLPYETIFKTEQGTIHPDGTYKEVTVSKTEYSAKLWTTPLKYTYGYSKEIFVKLPPRINPYPILGLLTEMH